MNEQQALRGDQLSPPKVGEVPCEWCGERSTGSFPIMHSVKGKRGARVATGMHVYFCERHRRQAAGVTRQRDDDEGR